MDIDAPTAGSTLVPITAGHVKLNKPLPWPIYDVHRTLLLNQGFVITSASQLERLLVRGMFHVRVSVADEARAQESKPAMARINPFAEYGAVLEKLEAVLDLVTRQQRDAEGQVLGLAKTIDRLCASDADACLALIYIYSLQPSAHEQTLFHSILCNLIARHLKLDPPRFVALMAASLTANVAVLRHQDRLNNAPMVLSSEQRAVINRHPQLSAQAIRGCGVSNAQWIQIVEQHHERGVGGGYPQGLRESQIVTEALILSLAERYTAMITKRAYRDRFSPAQAMQSLQAESAGSACEMALVEALMQVLTPNPPGCFVRLQNNEVALITRRNVLTGFPEAWAVTSSQGNLCLSALPRDTRNEDLRPVEQVEPLHLEWLNIPALWGYEG
ncbi:MAG TPA: HD domain-containing phosphohydrolase [Pseudomonas sp.]|uniref:HD-GYP domain-containing protein n=1 Tax=Pseudomonas sp. TaxID=306 RepID=UPI002ED898CA